MTFVGINAASNFVNLFSLDFCSQGQVFYCVKTISTILGGCGGFLSAD
jgi:hypothetical protein